MFPGALPLPNLGKCPRLGSSAQAFPPFRLSIHSLCATPVCLILHHHILPSSCLAIRLSVQPSSGRLVVESPRYHASIPRLDIAVWPLGGTEEDWSQERRKFCDPRRRFLTSAFYALARDLEFRTY